MSTHDQAALDRRDRAWWLDFAARVLVFVGGISAIVFIAAIVVFIVSQGLDFAVHRLDWGHLLTGQRWEPTIDPPSYGALPQITGTIGITCIAMAVAVPLSFGAAVYIGADTGLIGPGNAPIRHQNTDPNAYEVHDGIGFHLVAIAGTTIKLAGVRRHPDGCLMCWRDPGLVNVAGADYSAGRPPPAIA